jgi:hypothetical protein
MMLKTALAIVALALGLTTAVDAAESGVTCSDLHAGAAARVCRWHLDGKDSVEVYYGEPTAPLPAAPLGYGNSYPPPAYDETSAYDDYGYGWPWGYWGGAWGLGGRRRRQDHPHGFHNGFHGGRHLGAAPPTANHRAGGAR